MKKILLLLIISPLFCFSQHNHDEENHSHEHHSHNNEFAIGLGIIPEHENSLGFHAHYIKGIVLNNKIYSIKWVYFWWPYGPNFELF